MIWVFLALAFIGILLLAGLLGNAYNNHREQMVATRAVVQELYALRHMQFKIEPKDFAIPMHSNNHKELMQETNRATAAFLESTHGR